MIRIDSIHPDLIRKGTTSSGTPKLNSEWISLVNTSDQEIDIYRYFVINRSGDGFVITLADKDSLIVPPRHIVVVFSGNPTDDSDPPGMIMYNESKRLFLNRSTYLWNPREDIIYLYNSRETYLNDPDQYMDMLHFRRTYRRPLSFEE